MLFLIENYICSYFYQLIVETFNFILHHLQKSNRIFVYLNLYSFSSTCFNFILFYLDFVYFVY